MKTRNDSFMGKKVIILQSDFDRLMDEIRSMERRFYTIDRAILHLKRILLRGKKVEPSKMPIDAVSMNSTTKIRVQNTGNILTLQLVYPNEVDFTQIKISIFSSIGVAIFSRHIGDIVTYSTGLNKYEVEIQKIWKD